MSSCRLNLDICYERCGKHKYNIISGSAAALPLEFFTQAIAKVKQAIRVNLSGQDHGIRLRKSTITCDGDVLLTVVTDNDLNEYRNRSGDAARIDRAGAYIILCWHRARREWRDMHPHTIPVHANYNLTPESAGVLSQVCTSHDRLSISRVLDSLETQSMVTQVSSGAFE